MPWEVDEFPAEWMDVIDGLANGLPDMQEGQGAVENIKSKWLEKQKYRHGR